MRAAFVLPLLLAGGQGVAPEREGNELLGKPAPSLEGLRWIGRDPVRVEDLRGKVVLARWWTNGCSLCTHTAPALRELQDRYGTKGLEILAIHHPKPRPRAVEDDFVKRAAAELRMPGALAADPDWTALRRWWLDARPRSFTSISFLLDKKGRIRFVHPGGEFHRSDDPAHADCAREFDALDAAIREALAERDG